MPEKLGHRVFKLREQCQIRWNCAGVKLDFPSAAIVEEPDGGQLCTLTQDYRKKDLRSRRDWKLAGYDLWNPKRPSFIFVREGTCSALEGFQEIDDFCACLFSFGGRHGRLFV
jgi:hypothetical protein